MISTDFEHRALRHLAAAEHKHPKAWHQIARLRAARGAAVPNWPDWLFLPFASTLYMVATGIRISGAPILDAHPPQLADAARLATVAAWRATQGIYHFDPLLRAALVAATIPDDLRADMFLRLPEWCVYIETPGLRLGKESIEGCFAHLDGDSDSGPTALRLALDVHAPESAALVHIALDLRARPLSQAVNRMQYLTVAIQPDMAPSGLAARICGEAFPGLPALVKLVLFLCTPQADIRCGTRRSPRPSPTRKAGQGGALAAERPTHWMVGSRNAQASMPDWRLCTANGLASTQALPLHAGARL